MSVDGKSKSECFCDSLQGFLQFDILCKIILALALSLLFDLSSKWSKGTSPINAQPAITAHLIDLKCSTSGKLIISDQLLPSCGQSGKNVRSKQPLYTR